MIPETAQTAAPIAAATIIILNIKSLDFNAEDISSLFKNSQNLLIIRRYHNPVLVTMDTGLQIIVTYLNH